MTETTLTCPSCQMQLLMTVSATTSGAVSRIGSPHSPRPESEVAALLAFVETLPRGEHQTTDLLARYDAARVDHPEWPELGARNFGLAMRQAGIAKIRRSGFRGWVL